MRIPIVLTSAVLALGACRSAPQVAPTSQPPNELQPAPAPRVHRLHVLPATGWATADSESEMDVTVAPFDATTGAGSANQVKARFRGTDRRAAKTSIANASTEDIHTLNALIASLPTDDSMQNHDPVITRDASMTRVDQEQRNVRIKAWVYAIKYEADQDWHMIVGSDSNGDNQTEYFNTEVSGLPPSDSDAYDTLLKVRQSLADILGKDQLPGPGNYATYQPFAVIIEGSLFYDVDHAPGVVGPGDMKPHSSWEIHPITHLELAE
jgi:hypothetical protein